VIGHQWWWQIQYVGLGPSNRLETANEIHIPVGQPVELTLESRDVIHSFWVPALHGKVDLIPGVENHLRLQADRPGTYEGQCAEFCGAEHARMRFLVVAQSPEDFAKWMHDQSQPAQPPLEAAAIHGADLFQSRACGLCHTVRGTQALGTIGPDLTHFGSRQRLAADSLPNQHAYVAAWITRAQSFKPGALMPDVTNFRGDELDDLARYIDQLR
jgi:cytochrome c oxidase subunit 2